MVTIYTTKELKYKSFNKFSRFVLIGNNIDGYVDVDMIEFEDFEDVKSRLSDIIESINFAGEWDLKFYQVPDNYNIKLLYGYYKVPRRGKLIFELNYCRNIGEKIKVFINDAVIHFHLTTEFIKYDEESEDELLWNVDVDEEFLTILLYDKFEKKVYNTVTNEVDEDYFLKIRGVDSFWELTNNKFY